MSVPRSTVILRTNLPSYHRRSIDDGKSAAKTTDSNRASTDETVLRARTRGKACGPMPTPQAGELDRALRR